MVEMSLEKTYELYLTYLKNNDFENSISFLEKLISNSPNPYSLDNKITLEHTELCLDYYHRLVQFIEKYNFQDKTKKNLYFNCFKKLYSIYNPYHDYEFYPHNLKYSEKYGETIPSKSGFIKQFFDFYFLENLHCIVDENHSEYKDLKNAFEQIDQKFSTWHSKYGEDYDWSLIDRSHNFDGPDFESFLTEKEKNLQKLITYESDYRVNFHPYNGKLINEIIKETPSQFLDLLINLHHFSVYESLLMDEKLMQCGNFLNALIKNRAKRIYLNEQNKLALKELNGEFEEDYATSKESYEQTDNLLKDNPISDAFDVDPSSEWNVD